jgi:O-acetylhomoserine (thiol)-lyase
MSLLQGVAKKIKATFTSKNTSEKRENPMSKKQGQGTLAVHAGQVVDPTTHARAVPIYQTTSYVFEDTQDGADLFGLKKLGNIYTRLMNPTTDVLEKRIAALEGGTAAVAFSSGAAAITASILNLAKAGDHIVSVSQLYGGTYDLFVDTLPKLGIEVTFVDANDPEAFRKAIRPNTKAIYGESQGNPRLNIFKYDEIVPIARAAGIPIIIDNTALTPYLHRPFDHGANIVVHSLTKFIGGHGTSLGGIIVDGGNFDWGNGKVPGYTEPDSSYHGLVFWDAFKAFPPAGGANVAFAFHVRTTILRNTGGTLSPFNSFLILQGAETLHVRLDRHSSNALKVAQYLEKHPKVAWVNYPGLPSSPAYKDGKKYILHNSGGALIGFGVKGGAAAGRKVIEALKLFSDLANIGDAKSLAIHPASTTHSQLNEKELLDAGVTPDFIRLSVGIEDVEDIIDDLNQALAQI